MRTLVAGALRTGAKLGAGAMCWRGGHQVRQVRGVWERGCRHEHLWCVRGLVMTTERRGLFQGRWGRQREKMPRCVGDLRGGARVEVGWGGCGQAGRVCPRESPSLSRRHGHPKAAQRPTRATPEPHQGPGRADLPEHSDRRSGSCRAGTRPGGRVRWTGRGRGNGFDSSLDKICVGFADKVVGGGRKGSPGAPPRVAPVSSLLAASCR